jgi:hypothetical protein
MSDANDQGIDHSSHRDNEWEGLHRRELLGAVGGFALAASGLFLPAAAAEKAAREGANGGALGGRRGKNRRGRAKHQRQRTNNKRQGHGKEKENGAGRLPWQERGIAFHVTSYGANLDIQFWRLFPGTAWELVGEQSVTPGHPVSFQDARPICGVWIGSENFIRVENPTLMPWVEMQFGVGGEMRQHDGWVNGNSWWKIPPFLLVNDTQTVYPGGQWTYSITRTADSDDYKEISIGIHPD